MANSKAQSAPDTALVWSTPYAMSDRSLLVEAGDLSLAISRLSYEWQLRYSWSIKGNDGAFDCRFGDESPVPDCTLDRIGMQPGLMELSLLPRLADRPVVVRPSTPLIVPASSEITLYVSHPLWLCLDLAARVQRELPMQQLSDTWMGSLTGEGQLCYGSHTHARLDNAQLRNLPYRALTPVTMKNKSAEDFTLERLSIPAPYLSLFEGDSQLHTESLTIVMEPESLRGVVEIGKVKGKKALTLPRKESDRGILVSALENLFA